ncbi:MAG: carbamoyltransferase N-terminal domain-containing protein [Candidatus Zixiibacteriota bacterium]
MIILGISAYYHDSSAALVCDGRLVSAAAEERFTGIKHDSSFPVNAVNFCLNANNLGINEIDKIVFYEKPLTKFDRIISGYMQTAPKSYAAFRKAIPIWLREKLWTPQTIKKKLDYNGEIFFVEHHLSHAAGTYYSSPFDSSTILTIDGVGEWTTASIGIGEGNKIRLVKTMNYPHSVGLLYSAFTYFLGFRVNSSEYKVMGLAPYGKPVYADLIKNELVKIFEDGSIVLNMKYFSFHYGLRMTGRKFEKLFGRKRRLPESELSESDKNMAASIQAVTEKIILKMAQYAREKFGNENLCLAGGVALNSSAAGKLKDSGLFKNIYIQPASSDSGAAAGAALYLSYSLSDKRKIYEQPYFSMEPTYGNKEIVGFLIENDIRFHHYDSVKMASVMAREISEGKICALFNGQMEFGPRALGFRSIIADPRNPNMKNIINKKIKFRESFRPFAPAVLEEHVDDFFENGIRSPYMLFNFKVKKGMESVIPAVTHIDNTARIQTVNRSDNKLFYNIIEEFAKITGVPVLLNTSFNLRGRPIVNGPTDAIKTFVSSGIDLLVMQDSVIYKQELSEDTISKFKIASGID